MTRMQDSRMPVTAIVPVRNEERNIARCLERLVGFAEVIVVDSNSTDRTVEIAESLGARVIQFNWDGAYPKKRNWTLDNVPLVTDWVLFIDADEFVDAAFLAELGRAVAAEGVDGYWLTYTNYFLGRRLSHGVPVRKLALFRASRGRYERIDEAQWSSLDMEVHEHPVLGGTIGSIAQAIEHNDFKGLKPYLERHVQYAAWEVARVRKLRADRGAWDNLTGRQVSKYRNLGRWWFPYAYFLYQYVARLGFLDGGAGFDYAFYKLWYFKIIRDLDRSSG